MSDITIAFNAPVLVKINDKDVSFPKLSPVEIAAECNRIKFNSVLAARKLVKEYNVTGAEAVKLVRAAEIEEPTVNALWADVCTPQPAIDVLVKSLVKTGLSPEDAKATVTTMEIDQLTETALKVCGWKADKKAEVDADPKKDEAAGFNR